MNVLYVAYRMPYPPDKGERIRMFHQIRHLAGRARVHLVSPVRTDDSAARRALESLCASVRWVPDSAARSLLREVGAILTGSPRSRATHCSVSVRRAVAEVVTGERVDVALISTVFMADCADHVRETPVVVDLMDVYSDVWRSGAIERPFPWSVLDALEARRLRVLEKTVSSRVRATVFVSEGEASRFENADPASVRAIGNGVDADYFRRSDGGDGRFDPTVVFLGSLDYEVNERAVLYFASEVLPLVRAAVPDVTFLVVGREPPASIRALGRAPGIEVTGTVADVRPFLEAAHVSVAPFPETHGLPNKILESLAMELPVVATSAALSGLGSPGCDALVAADEPDGMARAIVDLLRDEAKRTGLGQVARSHVLSHHRWEDRGNELFRLLAEVVG